MYEKLGFHSPYWVNLVRSNTNIVGANIVDIFNIMPWAFLEPLYDGYNCKLSYYSGTHIDNHCEREVVHVA